MTLETSANARIDGLFELAFRRHQAGELREAEQLYRSILEADPRQLDALHFLGMIALQDGRPQDAVDLIGKAIAGNDRIAAYHAGIAEAYGTLGQRDSAIAHYRSAIAIEPGLWGALHQLGTLLLDQGNASDALEFAKRALTWKDTASGRTLFTDGVRNATSLPNDPVFRSLLTRAMLETWARPVELAGAAVTVIKSHPAVADGIARAMASWPRRLSPAECGPVIGMLAGDPLLRALMDSTPVCDAGLERLLTSARTILLDAAVNANKDVAGEMIPFAASLARQCFINDYVFDVSSTERQALGFLRNSVATALTGRAPVFAIHIVALAAYMPLHVLDRTHGLLARTWPEQITALIAEQVSEPEVEAKLRTTMPRLTPIANDVSIKVREQYEENPYPRWTRIAPVPQESDVAGYLRAVLPAAPIDDAREPAAPDILIAGCGTGQQSITTAQRFPQARVLAIDLSLASLGYAQRKSAGLQIEYAQADIIELKSLGRSFDVIEASGVLHHLADPMQGWSTLLGLLKPGGFMRLGLYSALARTGIAAARQMIVERGYAATAQDIRSARQAIISAQDRRFATILSSPDFYSTSACRDLLFHTEEHVLTLPQIDAFLTQHRLSFLGFELDPQTLAAYRTRFPEDGSMTDLAKWHAFETAHPDIFGAMYQFWVRKGADTAVAKGA